MTERSRLQTGADVLITVIFLAACAGLAESLLVGIRHFVLHAFVMSGKDVVWMAPLGTALVLLVPALPLGVLAMLLPRRVGPRLVVTLLAWLAFFSILSGVRELHAYAALVLAAGLALRAGWYAGAHYERWRRLTRRGAVVLAAVITLASLAGAVRLRLLEASWERRVAAMQLRAPNLLLLILDTVRAPNLHSYGYPRPTSPAIDRLAAEGVLFERAISPSTWTLPAHGSMFTGRRPGELSGRWHTPMDDAAPTLAERLRERGYRTAGFTANLIYTSRESGLTRGFTHYDGYQSTFKQVLLSAPLAQLNVVQQIAEARTKTRKARALLRFNIQRPFEPRRDDKSAAVVHGELRRWLEGNDGRPFFAFVNLFDGHDANAVPAPFDTLFSRQPGRVDTYDQLIAYMDHEVGLIRDELAQRGELDNTIIVVTADHGESLGDHGLYSHGNSLYMEALHVPLIIRYPAGVPAGTRVARPVSTQYLGSMVFDVAGLEAPAEFSSGSLAAYWGATPSPAEPVFAEVERLVGGAPRDPAARGAMRAIVEGDWHYILNGDGVQELYNYRNDPAEQHNLASEEPELLERLRTLALSFSSGY